jgi:hypothetical protein
MSRNAQGNRNNLEFKVRKEDSYKLQSYKRGRASAALNLRWPKLQLRHRNHAGIPPSHQGGG